MFVYRYEVQKLSKNVIDMKKIVLTLVAATISCLGFAGAEYKEVFAVKKVIESACLDGALNIGDMAKIDDGFHADFSLQLLGVNGHKSNVSLNDLKQYVKTEIADGKLPRRVGQHVRINYLSVDVGKDIALVQLDYILNGESIALYNVHLTKYSDSWKIVKKSLSLD